MVQTLVSGLMLVLVQMVLFVLESNLVSRMVTLWLDPVFVSECVDAYDALVLVCQILRTQ